MVSGYSMAGNLKTSLDADIIICGAGLSGLSLTYRALKAGIWDGSTIILIDQCLAKANDKTWSFWKKERGPFDHLIQNSWSRLHVFSNDGEEIPLDAGPYTYNTIRSIDFYKYVLDFLVKQPNVQIIESSVESVTATDVSCKVETVTHSITARYVFNSIYERPKDLSGSQYFLQHFKGITIKSPEIAMEADSCFLMDYRTGQENGTTFFYTLPFASDELFVEYTLFSKQLLPMEDYDTAIATYVRDVLKLSTYSVIHSEFGVIPMTDFRFRRNRGRIINIGTIGGDTRGASGYTFTNVQKTISRIIDNWKPDQRSLSIVEPINAKHQLFDSILLNVLDEDVYPGHRIFRDLFKNTKASTIFRFLDGDTTIREDLKIILSLKPWPFVRGFAKVIKYRFGL